MEGFFTICKLKGLTGSQGVIIPSANVRNLMLRAEVIQAVKDEQFHIWPITTVEEGLALLTNMEVGEVQEDGHYPPGSFNHRMIARLEEFRETIKEDSGLEKQDS